MKPLQEQKEREHFTRGEVRTLIGKRYKATAGYAGVPAGTIGKIVDFYSADRNPESEASTYGVDVMWEDVAREHPTDGFSRTDLLMVFKAGPHAGTRAMVPLDGGM